MAAAVFAIRQPLATGLQPSERWGCAMIERQTFPTDFAGCEITVVTERLADNAWAAVSTIHHFLDGGTRTIDLPVSTKRFETQADARDFGLRQAVTWLERNMPSDERKTA